MNDLKETLFQDLCARLPYHTMVECKTDYSHKFDEELSIRHIMNFYQFDVKPYLRPLSDMTKDEVNEYLSIKYKATLNKEGYKWLDFKDYKIKNVGIVPIDELFDWLNAHHFDYRGLIERGLALKAKKGMYKN